jgi:CubicO group peptidase (beta-lactamase class C family)
MENTFLTSFLENEMKKGLFSAYQFSMTENGSETFSGSGGTVSFKNHHPVNTSTPFDIASVTKIVLTVPVFYEFVSQDVVSPSDPVKKFLNQFQSDVTIIELLDHTSGYPAWIPFYEKIDRSFSIEKRKNEAKKIILNLPLEKNIKIYSDINYILLGFIIEQISGKTLDVVFQEFLDRNGIKREIGFAPTHEVPLTAYSILRSDYPCGTVEDENSYFLGGLTGHAGLFASACETAGYFGDLFQKEWFVKTARDLDFAGFDRPEGINSNYGINPDHNHIGHLGFTGTAILIDPEKNKIATLFTNSTHPSAEKYERKERIKKVRQQFFPLLT